ncbi:hypothetical protein AB0I55_00215 [Actinocatenispora sera]|jgi:hypothetical protein|nr:hypothetical protein [Actinocatenispora sera]
MDDGKQPDEPAKPPEAAGSDDEIPTLRDELRTAAQYGVAGRWANRRREKIRAEIERNRRGDYKVPTWVLALILVVVVVGWVLLIVLA